MTCVVMAWDRAFIYEPRNDSDVADILEVANAQLLEFRYYDELLDDELPRMYEMVRRARRPLTLPGLAALRRSRAPTLHSGGRGDRADGEGRECPSSDRGCLSGKGLSGGAVDFPRSHGQRLRAGKLAIIRDTYAALYAEASSARGELLELAIILLIVIEIGIALVHHAG